MKYKILIPIIYIVFCISTQSAFCQTNDKWLPSSISIYPENKTEIVEFRFEYDTSNRLTEFVVFTDADHTTIENGKKFEYNSNNQLVKSIEYLSINDSIISDKQELDFKLVDDNKIEIKIGNHYTGILHLDKDKKMLIKAEESTTESFGTKNVVTTFEYRNNLLYKRIVNTALVRNRQIYAGKSEDIPSESEVELTSNTYEIETNKLFPFNDMELRWLLTYFKIDDLVFYPSLKIESSDLDKKMTDDIDVSYHYNNENYLTGWTVVDSKNSEEIHCKIKYVKAK